MNKTSNHPPPLLESPKRVKKSLLCLLVILIFSTLFGVFNRNDSVSAAENVENGMDTSSEAAALGYDRKYCGHFVNPFKGKITQIQGDNTPSIFFTGATNELPSPDAETIEAYWNSRFPAVDKNGEINTATANRIRTDIKNVYGSMIDWRDFLNAYRLNVAASKTLDMLNAVNNAILLVNNIESGNGSKAVSAFKNSNEFYQLMTAELYSRGDWSGLQKVFYTPSNNDDPKAAANMSDENILLNKFIAGVACSAEKTDEARQQFRDKCKEAVESILDGPICGMVSTLQGLSSAMMGIIGYNMQYRILIGDSSNGIGFITTAMQQFIIIANIGLAILFLIIIYSTATSVGLSNYSVKKIMPRLIVVALAINLSYFLCAIAVDLSNISGAGALEFFNNIIVNATEGMTNNTDKMNLSAAFGNTMGAIGTFALAPVLVIIFLIMLIVSLVGFGFMGLGLSFRTVILTALIIVSPIAIVSLLLPNTSKLFRKWADHFLRLLLIYPIVMGATGICYLVAYAVLFTQSSQPDNVFSAFSSIFNLFIVMLCSILPILIAYPLFKKFGGLAGKLTAKVEDVTKKIAVTVAAAGLGFVTGGIAGAAGALPGMAGKFGQVAVGGMKRLGATGKGPAWMRRLGNGMSNIDGRMTEHTNLANAAISQAEESAGIASIKPSSEATNEYRNIHGARQDQAREKRIKSYQEQWRRDGWTSDNYFSAAINGTDRSGRMLSTNAEVSDEMRVAALRQASLGKGDVDKLLATPFDSQFLRNEAASIIGQKSSSAGFVQGSDAAKMAGGTARSIDDIIAKKLESGENLRIRDVIEDGDGRWQAMERVVNSSATGSTTRETFASLMASAKTPDVYNTLSKTQKEIVDRHTGGPGSAPSPAPTSSSPAPASPFPATPTQTFASPFNAPAAQTGNTPAAQQTTQANNINVDIDTAKIGEAVQRSAADGIAQGLRDNPVKIDTSAFDRASRNIASSLEKHGNAMERYHNRNIEGITPPSRKGGDDNK